MTVEGFRLSRLIRDLSDPEKRRRIDSAVDCMSVLRMSK